MRRVLKVQRAGLLAGRAAAADLVISPDTGGHSLFHFDMFAELAAAGEAAAQQAVPALKGLLAGRPA
jgi:hypothetical protein